MSDIIKLLPDSVANQIAAGEVIQRPASVVKELIENAIDAGAENIKINIKDAGRTLVQVIDDGKGMSFADARMAFERHATSKIREANDLFAIKSMGFRGEALASIAAIADVELRTKCDDGELGTFIHIAASEIKKQEIENCPKGSNFSIKNLFFNVPARRKFLKSNSTEFKHIINEVQRVALANPLIAFSLYHNSSTIFELQPENERKRIGKIFGKNINQSLVPVKTDTSIINIKGYIGQPQFARKTYGEQFFFVNGRYMKHPYFHKAVLQAYDKILPPDSLPSYFLYFEIDPSNIDINIHPTKTEIKFEDEKSTWRIIHACIRESLGKYNIVPSIEFNQSGSIDIPMGPTSDTVVYKPEIEVDHSYNPFKQNNSEHVQYSGGFKEIRNTENLNNWDKLYEGFEKENAPVQQKLDRQEDSVNEDSFADNRKFLQVKNKYILTPVKSGLMVIDQRRAHERILYEGFIKIINNELGISQRQLFPAKLELSADDSLVLCDILGELKMVGFEIRNTGKGIFYIDSVPGMLCQFDAKELVEKILNDFKFRPVNIKEEIKEQLAQILAGASAINKGTQLNSKEIGELFDNLFACQIPNFSPSGKNIIKIIQTDEFEKMLK